LLDADADRAGLELRLIKRLLKDRARVHPFAGNGGFWRILLQKSKIERCRKSRESGFLGASTAAIPRSADAKVRGHFCAKQ
jgi:hypothetical protein